MLARKVHPLEEQSLKEQVLKGHPTALQETLQVRRRQAELRSRTAKSPLWAIGNPAYRQGLRPLQA